MKKLITAIMAVMMFSSAAVTLAAPDDEIKFFPETVITSDSGVLTVNQGETLKLTATTTLESSDEEAKVDSETWVGASQTSVTPSEIVGSTESKADFTAAVAGVYDVSYTINLRRGQSHNTGVGFDEVEIEVVKVELTIVVLPMAAPAVANRILQYNGVKPSYGKGMNYISDVAKAMGPGAVFYNGMEEPVEKGLWDEELAMEVSNPAYREAVYDFLLKLKPGLMMPEDEFFAQP